MTTKRNAVGIVRVSRVRGREGETFASPTEQRQRIADACDRDGLTLVETIEELEVSGGTPLDRRAGLRHAVEAVEDGRADVIVVAYFDRLVRSVAVQAEVVDRVEKAGGAILAVDVGEVRADTASRWLSASMLGMVAEYQRRATVERTAGAKQRAVARGVPPFARIPPGYRKRRDGTLEPDEHADAVAEAFRLRADGRSLADVRAFLRAHGVERAGIGTVQQMLASRIYLGELHFGSLVNLHSHEPIVDEMTWRRVQRTRLPRGRRPHSERLLSRLGVLRCASCGARLVISSRTKRGRSEFFYRCPTGGDCPQRVSVSADLVERVVIDAVQRFLRGITGSASGDSGVEDVRAAVDRVEGELGAAVEAFAGFEDIAATRERLAGLRAERERLLGRLAELEAVTPPTVTVTADDWDLLTLDAQRALVRTVVERVDVAPGGGAERITVHPRSSS